MSSAGIDLRALDALRGLLAAYVLAGHARWLLWTGNASWIQAPHGWWENALAYSSAALRYGNEAVMVFFALSGFFIHLPAATGYAAGRRDHFDVRRYAARRVQRLVPPYLLALLLTLMLDMLGRSVYPDFYLARTGDALVDQSFRAKGYDAENVVPALLLLPSALGRDFGSNGPLWSIAYEVVYYVIYPGWLAIRRFAGLSAYPIAVVIAALVAFLADGFSSTVALFWPVWMCGAALAEWLATAHSRKRGAWMFFAMAGVALALHHAELGLWWNAACMLVLGGGMVAGTALSNAANRFPSVTSAIAWFGMRSYSIYLLHFPVVALISAWAFSTLGARPSHGWLALAGGLTAATVGVAGFWLVERRFLHRPSR
jgi:peptidoglycan/LPS O-acetylase OafA/YrhL